MQPDKETQKKIWEAKEMKLMCEGDGWKLARQRLINLIINLSDILEMNETDPAKLSLQLAVNKQTIQILIGWLLDIEGTANDTNIQEFLKKEKNDSYLKILT